MELKATRSRDWSLYALRCLALVIGLVALAASAAPQVQAVPGGTIVVRSDRGGLIGQRSREIRSLRASGQRVELRGTCLSACTMYLSLPNVCVSPVAVFGFHGPTRNGKKLARHEFEHWSEVMARNYREPLRSWFMSKARYRTSGYYEISGAELIRLGYPTC